MDYENLLRRGSIKRFDTGPAQVKSRMDKHNGQIMPVQFDDIYWKQLNRDR